MNTFKTASTTIAAASSSRAVRAARAVFLAGTFAGLAACNGALDSDDFVADDPTASEDPMAFNDGIDQSIAPGLAELAEREAAVIEAVRTRRPMAERTSAAEKLAGALAAALRDPTARHALHDAIGASRVKEGKLHLRTQLAADPRLRGAMMEGGAMNAGEITALLDVSGPLEIYLPVPEHRQQWKGDADLIVASQIDEHDVPTGVDLAGNPVELSLEAPPETPTIVIVPAESFDPSGAPWKNHLLPEAPSTLSLSATQIGLWVNEVHVNDHSDYEPWTRGSPEFEMHIQRADNRATLVCAAANSIAPYKWDMNGDDYTTPFLAAGDWELPQNVNTVMAMYEDDDTTCVIVEGKDYVKLAEDALKNAFSAYMGIKSKGLTSAGWVLNVANAYVAAKSLIATDDDFVGVTAGTSAITANTQTFYLKDTAMNNRGSVKLRWNAGCSSNTCGGHANGCWCDAACVQYGDCCGNACTVCGQCD